MKLYPRLRFRRDTPLTQPVAYNGPSHSERLRCVRLSAVVFDQLLWRHSISLPNFRPLSNFSESSCNRQKTLLISVHARLGRIAEDEMETSVVESTLTDGSKVYAVVFVDGAQKAVIECVDENSAYRLQNMFQLCACYAVIDPHRVAV